MSAKELRLTIPGYSAIRWGNTTYRTSVGPPVTSRMPGWKNRLIQDIARKRLAEPQWFTGNYGWTSVRMDHLIRDIKECIVLKIPFKSTNTELRIDKDPPHGYLYARGLRIGTIDLRTGNVSSLNVPEEYHKYQLYLLRKMGISIHKKGRRIIWNEGGRETIITKGIDYHVRHPESVTSTTVTSPLWDYSPQMTLAPFDFSQVPPSIYSPIAGDFLDNSVRSRATLMGRTAGMIGMDMMSLSNPINWNDDSPTISIQPRAAIDRIPLSISLSYGVPVSPLGITRITTVT